MRNLMLVLLMSFLFSRAAYCPETLIQQKENIIWIAKKQIFLKEVNNKPFSRDLLIKALFFENIKSPEIVFIQARIETGSFTSDVFINGNNLFGMRLARVRETTAIGEYQYHAKYNNWYDSVLDYKLFQEWYTDKSYDLTDYTLFLKDMGYATDKRYIDKIKEMS